MNTKLTLSIEKEIIEKAKFYAKNTGRSLSDLVEKYFDQLTTNVQTGQVNSKIKNLVGIIQLPTEFDLKTEKDKHAKEKYHL